MSEKLAEFLSVFFGFRKLLIMVTLFVLSIVFRIKGYINGAEMVDLLKTTVIAYIGANGVSKIVQVARDHIASKTPQVASDAPAAGDKPKDQGDDEATLDIQE